MTPDREALWAKFTGGEKLAYGCGYRDARAESLAAVRAAVEGLMPPSVTTSSQREATATIAITLRHVLAAIDKVADTP